jgi:amino acid adenylation domain-containing protein
MSDQDSPNPLATNVSLNPIQQSDQFEVEGTPVAELTAVDRQQVLVDWNATAIDFPSDRCVHHLVEAQVERTPDAIAVVFPATASGQAQDVTLTYRQLNDRANQLAHALQDWGVGPDVLVAVNLPRSLEMTIAILGILKAGGAYIPLDPAYPAERLEFMLADTQAPIVLTHSSLAQGLPSSGARIVCLDTAGESIANHSTANPDSSVTPDRLTYVIYTSGSTGKPKGVMLEHRTLVNLVSWQLRESALGVGARTLQFAALSFDVSFQELFSTWVSGGTLVLFSEEIRRDALRLLKLICSERIERLFLPFIALQHLAEAVDTYKLIPTSLREVVTAGEQLQVNRYVGQMFSQLNSCLLVNQYGPSESHVVTAFTLQGATDQWPALPPIGKPISNSQIYLLDADLQPVAIGEPGNLYISGVCLARGYLNRPELTAERFISSPFQAGERLYQSGDVARYLLDGNIEYLGRADNQVKIRGFRIELGELETALTGHAAIKQAVVMAREDQPGNKRLVAYLVANPGETLVTTHLRQYLLEIVPDYAVPSLFISVEAMPLTPSGKIDRRALPAPDTRRPQLAQAYRAPRNPSEQLLGAIWGELLHLDQVGIDDNFFELGGDSLLILQVAAQIQQQLNIEIPVVKLFQYPTIAELANFLNQGASDRPSQTQYQERAQRQKARLDHRKQALNKRNP